VIVVEHLSDPESVIRTQMRRETPLEPTDLEDPRPCRKRALLNAPVGVVATERQIPIFVAQLPMTTVRQLERSDDSAH
jgi:hypothetical protein